MKYLKLNSLEKILTFSHVEEKGKIFELVRTLLTSNNDLYTKEDNFTNLIYSIIPQLSREIKETQFIVLRPTIRECREFVAKNYSLIRSCHLSIRGVSNTLSRGDLNTILNENNTILVGTPGIILRALKENKFNKNFLRFVVVDQIDELFFQGYREDIKEIFNEVEINTRKVILTNNKVEAAKEFINELEGFETLNIQEPTLDIDNFNRIILTIDLIRSIDKQILIPIKENKKSEELFASLFKEDILFSYITKNSLKVSEDETEGIKEYFKKPVILVNNNAVAHIDLRDFDYIINFNVKKLPLNELELYLALNSDLIKTGILPTTIKYGKKSLNLLTKTAKSSLKKVSEFSKNLLDDE